MDNLHLKSYQRTFPMRFLLTRCITSITIVTNTFVFLDTTVAAFKTASSTSHAPFTIHFGAIVAFSPMFVGWTCDWCWFVAIILFNTSSRASRSSCRPDWCRSYSCRWAWCSNHIRTSFSWRNAEIRVCAAWYHSFGTFTSWFTSHSAHKVTTSVITNTIGVITAISTFVPNLIVRTATSILWRSYIINILTRNIA